MALLVGCEDADIQQHARRQLVRCVQFGERQVTGDFLIGAELHAPQQTDALHTIAQHGRVARSQAIG